MIGYRLVATVGAAALVGVASLAACDTGDGREVRPAGPDQTATLVRPTTTTAPPAPAALGSGVPGEGVGDDGMTLRAPWVDEAVIDAAYTCAASGGTPGTGTSPALAWSGVPAGTTDLALVVTDLAADGFVHWVATGIDPASTGVAEGQAPDGAVQATNGFGAIGWGGPCPPADGTEHQYLFQLYALGQDLGLADGFAAEQAISDIETASIGTVSVVGRFTRLAGTTTTTVGGPAATAAATTAGGAAVGTAPTTAAA